ncbi:MAG: hypothetical protein M1120_03960 [Patescibacteria group bacterium]|nr:hypothetical protein [Patescibacteria group bacterium]
MPKKTRQEKIIADLRRKLAQTSITPAITPKLTEPVKHNHLESGLYSYKTKTAALSFAASKKTVAYDYSFVFSDLRRIIILTVFAVSWEFLLYIILPK